MPKKSWKTSASGLASILTGLGIIIGGVSNDDYSALAGAIPAILAGFGLLFARDNNKTSEEVGAK